MFESISNQWALIVGVVTTVCAWFAGRHRRQQDDIVSNTKSIKSMQATIDILVKKNSVLAKQISDLNEKIVEQSVIITELKGQLAAIENVQDTDPC